MWKGLQGQGGDHLMIPISFLVNSLRLLKTIVHGLNRDAEFRVLLFFITILVIGGTLFFHTVEGWSVLDSVYFCITTMATIGLGDLTPSSPIAKLFTMIYSILSIGCFVALCSKIAVIIVNDSLHGAHRFKRKRMKRSDHDDEDTRGPTNNQ
jgi:hypothetical protein